MKNVQIIMSGTKGEIIADGKPVERVVAFELKARAGQLPTLHLEIFPEKLEINGDVELTEKTYQY